MIINIDAELGPSIARILVTLISELLLLLLELLLAE
jgi:hypothetical protein